MPSPSTINPLFAREASQLLLDGSVARATELCLQGTKWFPKYATGYLILGKCLDAAGRQEEALAAYRRALSLLPDSPTLDELVRQAEARVGQKGFIRDEGDKKKLEPEGDRKPVETSATESAEVTLSTGTTVPAPQERVSAAVPEEESALEFLARRLRDVKRITPNPTANNEPAPPDQGTGTNFVTATMAEIFVGQGEYGEALNAYKELIRQHPGEEKYKRRLEEIEHLMKLDPPTNTQAS